MSQELIDKLIGELEEGMRHAKCRKCGCMQNALNSLEAALPQFESKVGSELKEGIKLWLSQMEDITNT